MKATVDVPDALYRRVKARAALEGRAVRDVTVELYESWLSSETPITAGHPDAAAWLDRWRRMGDAIAANASDARTTRRILADDRR